MEPPKELEGHRFVGDKRNQLVYDLEMSGSLIEAAVEEIGRAHV